MSACSKTLPTMNSVGLVARAAACGRQRRGRADGHARRRRRRRGSFPPRRPTAVGRRWGSGSAPARARSSSSVRLSSARMNSSEAPEASDPFTPRPERRERVHQHVLGAALAREAAEFLVLLRPPPAGSGSPAPPSAAPASPSARIVSIVCAKESGAPRNLPWLAAEKAVEADIDLHAEPRSSSIARVSISVALVQIVTAIPARRPARRCRAVCGWAKGSPPVSVSRATRASHQLRQQLGLDPLQLHVDALASGRDEAVGAVQVAALGDLHQRLALAACASRCGNSRPRRSPPRRSGGPRAHRRRSAAG